MEDYKYNLAKKGKVVCPYCHRKGKFVLYLDKKTGLPLHPAVGKCDGIDKCGINYTPGQYFRDNNIPFDNKRDFTPIQKAKPQPKPEPSYITDDIFRASLRCYERNTLFTWLIAVVGKENAARAFERYNVGTKRDGSAIFWQVDLEGRARGGRVIRYDSNGHRRKDAYPPVQWVHSIMKLPNFTLKQCLFGEHLLRDTVKPVAVVESEKTAVIASVCLPDYVWLATGGANLLNPENDGDKFGCLSGRDVVLFPDASKDGLAFAKWSEKAKHLRKICRSVSVSSLIEDNATDEERRAGFDIADYLVRFSPTEFVKYEEPTIQKPQPVEALPTAIQAHPSVVSDPVPYYAAARRQGDWSEEIKDLETWLDKTALPTKPFRLSVCETIDDCRLFVEVNLLTAKFNNGNPTFRPYLDRIITFKNIISA